MDPLANRLRQAIERSPDLAPSPKFMTALRQDLEAQALVPRRQSRLRTLQWLGIAASLVLAVVAGVAYRVYVRSGADLARAAVGDHRNCALKFNLTEKPITLEEAAQKYNPAFRVVEHLPVDDVPTSVGVAHVLERHSCLYGGRRFAHVVLKYQGAVVSLMMTSAEGTAAAPGSVDGMNVTAFRAGTQVVFLAGDVTMTDLVALVDSISGPLARALATV
jgi:hypothetical protein